MDQEVIPPDKQPVGGRQGFSLLGCFIAAFGATLLTFCLLSAAFVTTIWAFAHLLGIGDSISRILMLAGLLPAIWVSVWIAGRAWYVERRLSQHKDIDTPVFKLTHYLQKRSG